tara:strand:+ start:9394 stop:10095 length:702 start_codon:yes stop_codon:yes gene_type:complete
MYFIKSIFLISINTLTKCNSIFITRRPFIIASSSLLITDISNNTNPSNKEHKFHLDIPIHSKNDEGDIDNTNNRDIFFYGDVTEESCFYITKSLRSFENSKKPINLHIQSLGGELLPTFNVIDTIQNIQSPVHSYIEGYAASAASLISVCCNKRFMNRHSLMLIHQLSGMSQGTYSDMKEEMDNMNIYMKFAKDIYLEHSLLTKEVLNNILKYDNKWLDSSFCLQAGLVDEIL